MHRIIKLPRRRKRKCTRASRVGLLYSPGAPLILFRKPLGALRVAIHGVARRTTYAEKSLSLCADRGARPAQRLQTNQKLLHARSDAPKATLSALLLPQLQGYSILLCSALHRQPISLFSPAGGSCKAPVQRRPASGALSAARGDRRTNNSCNFFSKTKFDL
jgi:hypothetical protein